LRWNESGTHQARPAATSKGKERLKWKFMNRRQLTTELSHIDIGENLKPACSHARKLRLPLNTLVTFAPFRDRRDVPPPDVIAREFRRIKQHLARWCQRRGIRFTAVSVAHSAEDGSGRNAHQHTFMHLPSAALEELSAALGKIYDDSSSIVIDGRLWRIIDVSEGSDTRVKHASRYWGSTFDYITRHKSQQAYIADGKKSWRASRLDENGRHVGIKTPFVGRRWNVTRNINKHAIEAYEDAQRRKRFSAARHQRQAAA
jgi:hypothetical protein